MQITQVIPTNHGIKDNVYFTANMRKSPDGGLCSASHMTNIGKRVAGTETERLDAIKKFTEREYTDATNSGVTIWGLGGYQKGGIWAIPENGIIPTLAVDLGLTPGDNWNSTDCDDGASSVIETTNDNEIIYSGRKYIGKSITSKLNGSLTDSATSIPVTDATDFPTTGQAVILSNAWAETIEYTGKSTNTLTGVTRGKYYTTARAWSANSEIVGFINHWQTWTNGLDTSTKSPSVKWEDYIFIGRGYTVGGWKENDGSDLDEAMLTIPSNYEIVDMTTILTGAGTMILIAANRENTGDIFVWNGVDTDWARVVSCGENIKKLDKNFVALGSGLYQTDTYSLSLVAELPDDKNDITEANFSVYDIKVYKDEILCAVYSNGAKPRRRSGLWIYNLKDRDWLFTFNHGRDDASPMTIFIASGWNILLSTQYFGGSVDRLHGSQDGITGRTSYSQIVYAPNGGRIFKLQEILLNLHPIMSDYWREPSTSSDMDIDIIIRVYDYQSPFYQYTQTESASVDTSHLTLYKNTGLPRVGDRVEITNKNNASQDIAGYPRNITEIITNASDYEVTLDSALPEKPSASGINVMINPLKKLKTITLNSYKINPDDLRIVPVGQPKFKKLMIEIEIRDRGNESTASPAIQINSIELKMEVL